MKKITGKPDWIDKKRNAPILLCLILMSAIFLALYAPFLFGGNMYAYDDVGGDTIHQYLPVMDYELGQLKQGLGDGYKLNYGLGQYLSSLWLKYLNPVNLPLLLCGPENLHIGIMLATYMRYLIICIFAFLFFNRVLKNTTAAMLSSLLWTFSGYNVLWGQHYSFLASMAGVTVCMYGFQLFLDEDPKQYLVVLTTAFLACISYFFLYITCFLMLVYGIVYLRCNGKAPLQITKRAGQFLLCMLPSVCIAAPLLLPSLMQFFESARTAQVSSLSGGLQLSFYSLETMMSFLARWLSNDLIGVGNSFRGARNYYECASLSVSLLFVFSFSYLVQGKHKKLLLGLTGVSVLLLCMPVASRILVFSDWTQRWSYALCFGQVLVIGFAVAEFLANRAQGQDAKQPVRAVLLGDVILFLATVILLVYHKSRPFGWLEKSVCLKLVGLLLLYHIGFFLLWKGRQVMPVLVVLIGLELSLANYTCIHDRTTITVDQWYHGMYQDGTAQAVQWIREQDDSLYRINKTYASVYSIANSDPLMQDFNGMSVYSSTNSAHLLNLYESYGYPITGNWLWFRGTDSTANNMLGVKYLLADGNTPVSDDQYELLHDTGIVQIYRNKAWAGFGYLYEEELEASAFLDKSRYEQGMLLSQYFYRTEDNTGAGTADAIEGICYMDLIPYMDYAYDCIVEDGEDSLKLGPGLQCRILFKLPQIPQGWTVVGIEADIETEAPSQMEVYLSEDAENTVSSCDFQKGSNHAVMDWRATETSEFWWKPSQSSQWIDVKQLRLVLMNETLLQQRLEVLRSSSVQDLRQEGNVFRGTVSNSAEETAMLCVPLIYSDRWKVTLDGESVTSVNLNGGLLGVEIPQGEYVLRVEYDDTLYRVGMTIGVVALVCYLLGMWIYFKIYCQKEKLRKHDQF